MTTLKKTSTSIVALCAAISTFAANPQLPLLNDPVDVSGDFRDFSNFYYLADRLADFDPATHTGKILYQRSRYHVRHAFDNDLAMLETTEGNEFPENQYAVNPTLPFSIDFVSPQTVRIRMTSGPQVHPPQEELMLAGDVPKDDSWKYEKIAGGHRYTSQAGSVTILERPWHIEIRDVNGKLLTATDHMADNGTSFTPILPFSFVRRAADY
jgi:alpha-D-xyloside xylohydrolase